MAQRQGDFMDNSKISHKSLNVKKEKMCLIPPHYSKFPNWDNLNFPCVDAISQRNFRVQKYLHQAES